MQASRLALSLLRVGLVALALWLALPPSAALGQEVGDVSRLPGDDARHVDRFQVTLGPGGTLWDIATTRLPLTVADDGEQKAYALVLASFQHAFPDRRPEAVQPTDSFVLEVPAGTFVAQSATPRGDAVVYRSFRGDELTRYGPRSPLLYRLVRAEAPDQAEFRLVGGDASALDVARAIYAADPPDFLQVRTVRGALEHPEQRIVVDLRRPYLDAFRALRARATQVFDGPDGRKVYMFDPLDAAMPYLRVEDAVNDGTDPAAFPHLFRVAFSRDGVVRRYILTEPGDSLAHWDLPDDGWSDLYPSIKGWKQGQVERLAPFPSALSADGQLVPGRILVLRFDPIPESHGLGARCLGGPVALVGVGWGLRLRARRRARVPAGLASLCPLGYDARGRRPDPGGGAREDDA